MKLPNAEQAVVDREKITDYLLSLTSPDCWSKARFFTRRGFTVGQWEVFAEALKAQGAAYEVAEIRETDQDIRYSVVGSIQTPDGSDPRIRTVWQIVRGSSIPRLITAHPRRR